MIHVVVAVIINHQNEVLITKRSAQQHQGNKWEFPGGKVDEGEISHQALSREINEEIGIEILSASLLTQITHQYNDKNVQLDVYEVKSWQGEPQALEGQPMRWVEKEKLHRYEFPAANTKIVHLLTV